MVPMDAIWVRIMRGLARHLRLLGQRVERGNVSAAEAAGHVRQLLLAFPQEPEGELMRDLGIIVRDGAAADEVAKQLLASAGRLDRHADDVEAGRAGTSGEA